MKIFIYKTLVVVFSIYILFQFTIGMKLNNYEKSIKSQIYDKEKREIIYEKIKDEIRSANKKENLFTDEEKKLFSNFFSKIMKELTVANSQ